MGAAGLGMAGSARPASILAPRCVIRSAVTLPLVSNARMRHKSPKLPWGAVGVYGGNPPAQPTWGWLGRPCGRLSRHLVVIGARFIKASVLAPRYQTRTITAREHGTAARGINSTYSQFPRARRFLRCRVLCSPFSERRKG